MRYHKHFIEEVWSIHTYIRCLLSFPKKQKMRCGVEMSFLRDTLPQTNAREEEDVE